MPTHYATYRCKHCGETFDATSGTMTDCPCGKTRVEPSATGTSTTRTSSFDRLTSRTEYHADDFITPTARTLELLDELKSLHHHAQECHIALIQYGCFDQTLDDGTSALNSIWSYTWASNHHEQGRESNQIRFDADFKRSQWGTPEDAASIEHRLERYVGILRDIIAGSFSAGNRQALQTIAEDEHRRGEEEPTGATNYTLHI